MQTGATSRQHSSDGCQIPAVIACVEEVLVGTFKNHDWPVIKKQ
jgi:hypothetical protein